MENNSLNSISFSLVVFCFEQDGAFDWVFDESLSCDDKLSLLGVDIGAGFDMTWTSRHVRLFFPASCVTEKALTRQKFCCWSLLFLILLLVIIILLLIIIILLRGPKNLIPINSCKLFCCLDVFNFSSMVFQKSEERKNKSFLLLIILRKSFVADYIFGLRVSIWRVTRHVASASRHDAKKRRDARHVEPCTGGRFSSNWLLTSLTWRG